MANIRFFIDYLGHFLTANSRHGVHSPFVYRLVDEVIYDFSERAYQHSLEELRGELKSDGRLLHIEDLGAGSKLKRSTERKVSDLARNALKPARIASLIARLAAEFKPRSIVELGTCLGLTSLYLSKASPTSRLITVEGCSQTAAVARENFAKMNAGVDLRVGNFDDVLPQVLSELPELDFLFIDGNHTREATLRYFHWALTRAHSGTVLIFDDIYWSEGMKGAWQTIKSHPDVRVTVDLFYIGLVFFKQDQEKEDFRIRFH